MKKDWFVVLLGVFFLASILNFYFQIGVFQQGALDHTSFYLAVLGALVIWSSSSLVQPETYFKLPMFLSSMFFGVAAISGLICFVNIWPF